MKRILQIGFIAATAAIALAPVTVRAQAGKCTEGITATGDCVDPGIAVTSRQSAIIFSQPKISYTAFPVLPAGDVDYRYPNQLIPNQQGLSATGTPPPPNN